MQEDNHVPGKEAGDFAALEVASRGFVGSRISPSAFSGTRASVSNVTITIIYETH